MLSIHCAKDSAPPTGVPGGGGGLASVTVTPVSDTISVSGTRQFTAVGKDAQGNTISFTPTWSVSTGNGSITSAGLFTAATGPGTVTIKATSGSVSGTATVTVTLGPLATIVVRPGNQTIAPAGTLQFSAEAQDAVGNTVTVTPVWSIASGGGTITSSGLFTAGSSPGASVVRATSGSISGSATVTVVSSSGMGAWTERAPMPTPRAYFATGVINGLLYVVGGANGTRPNGTGGNNEAYDPTSNTWSTKASMPTPRVTGGGVVNNILYVVGGNPGDGTGSTAVLEAYDPATDTWTTKAPMPTARSDFVTGVVNGILYVVGGYANNQYLVTVEAYDPVTNTWTTKAPLPAPRFGGAAVVNGILYVVSGLDAQNNVGTVDAYDPATNTWTSRAAAAMLTPRGRICVGAFNGLVYALGGDDGRSNGGSRTVEAYDPATNRWTAKADMHHGRESCGAESVAGRLFVVGGTVQGHFIEVTEAFQP